ncbi:ribonuclease HIII [Listeria seeligeri]|uniref:ribonuclease HIII n=1 Tax=Listeria seeligeri TaxID=1640 RepID=UPI0022EA3FC8|nr:ribonuclease HIII [Listeria seeligeri]
MANTVILVNQATMEKMKQTYLPFSSAKLPPGAVFAAKNPGVSITGYKSLKVMFQGVNGEAEAKKWVATLPTTTSKTPSVSKGVLPANFASKNVLGSDEVGTGDFFGPITVCAAYVEETIMPLLKELGVKDSKAMKDPEICRIAEKIMPVVPHSVLLCPNPKYNEMQSRGMNQGQMKALLHNRALENVLKKIAPTKPEAILIDQFAEKNTYYRYLAKEPTIIRENVFFATKAEGLHLSVAAASIIARYKFVQAFEEMSREVGILLPKGAGPHVDTVAAEIIERFGMETLAKYTKKHFANTEKALKIAKK